VRGDGFPFVIEHAVGVAVIRRDKQGAAGFFYCIGNSAYAEVNGLHSLDRGFEHSRMTHHVAVCEVQDYHIVLSAVYSLHRFAADFKGAHFGLHIVGGHLGRGDKYAVFSLVG